MFRRLLYLAFSHFNFLLIQSVSSPVAGYLLEQSVPRSPAPQSFRSTEDLVLISDYLDREQ